MSRQRRRRLDEGVLRAELERSLAERFGNGTRVRTLEQRPSPYRTSFAMHELEVTLDDGTALELLVKDLSWHTLKEALQLAKPVFVHAPLREIEVYRGILAQADLGTPVYYGAVADGERDRYWLFLERVHGPRLLEIGEFEIWQDVARWLARMHDRFADTHPALPAESTTRLLRYDRSFYESWIERAERFVAESAIDAALRQRLRYVASRYDRVISRLLELEVTFIHGEFYAQNVLVVDDERARRVCPIDWEMAAIGPRLVDLAALTAGGWSAAEKRALALAYREEATDAAGDDDAFLDELAWCRVHVAMQWVGWWESAAPEAHRRVRWLREALDAAQDAGL